MFQSFNRYLGVAVGEHLGYLLTGAWTVLVGVALTQSTVAPGWLGIPGIVIGVLLALCSLELVGPFEAASQCCSETRAPQGGNGRNSLTFRSRSSVVGVSGGVPHKTTTERRDVELLAKQPTTKGPAEMFTGDVWFDVAVRGEEPSRLRANTVRFSPGARTAWALSHDGPDSLCHRGSRARAVPWGDLIEIRPGDVIYTPPGEWHWHGAAPEQFMTHIALWEGPGADAGTAESDWGDHVTEAEYQAEPDTGTR